MKKFLVYFFFFTCLTTSQSQESNYTIKWYNTENGLSQLSIRYCVPDNHGFIWIGTELGLYRFDGLKFDEIKDIRYPNLNKQRIARLGKDKYSGKIYLKTNPENSIYVIENNKIEKIVSNNHEESLFTFNQYCLNKNSLLIKSLFKKKQNSFYLKDYYEKSYVTACLTSKNLYLPQENQLLIFDEFGNKINRVQCNSEIILFEFENNVLAIDKGVISLFKNGILLNKKVTTDLILKSYLNRNPSNINNDEIFGSEGYYYLKADGKIFQINFSDNKLTTKYLFNTPSEDVSCITFLKKENIFLIGTRTQGIAVLKPKLFNTIFLDVKKTYNAVNYNYSTVNISDELWYSASGWNFNTKTKKLIYDDYLFESKNSRFILPYKNKYYFQSNKGLWNVQNKKADYDFEYINFENSNAKSFSGYAYHKGQLFISTSNSLFSLNRNKLKLIYSLNDKNENKSINGIFSLNEKLLVLTTKGVYSYNPDTKKLNIVKELQKVNARYVKQINKDSFWLGCYGDGLFYVENYKVYKVKDKNLNISTAHAIEEDNFNNLWISTNDGLLKIKKSIAITNIKTKKYIECFKYTTENGLLTNEFNGGGTHPSLKTNTGIIGFTSIKGFVWFNENTIPKDYFNGKIVIDKVIVNNFKDINLKNNTYSIPNDANIVTFNFSYGYFNNRENITVAYKFEDQTNWTEIKANSFQIPRYKKGLHKLSIRIGTHGFSDKQAITKVFYLNFEPRYYESVWFWSLMFITFIFILYFTYKIGVYFSRKREKYLKERIKEQTVELELSILDLQQSKESLDKSLQVKNILLKEIHHRVKNNLQLVMSILNIQASDKENTSIEGFIEKGQSRIASMVLIHENLYQKEDIGNIDFETYTESLVNNIRTTFGEISERIVVVINMKDVFFDVQTSIPLGLIINELVTNSFKHGFPNGKTGQITISIEQINNTNYKLAIEDTGIGFPKVKVEKKSIGLELVSLLVLQLKGKLTIDSNNGTLFEIIFTIT